MKDCYIFDVDGTLADGKHRQHLVRGPKKNWPAYQKLASLDTPIWPVVNQLKVLHAAKKHIIIASGRVEDERPVTETWLWDAAGIRVGIDPSLCQSEDWPTIPIRLLMRKSRDYRNDSIIKEEIYQQLLAEDYNILGAFDDRNRVVQMWRRNGVFVFHVDQTSVSEDF